LRWEGAGFKPLKKDSIVRRRRQPHVPKNFEQPPEWWKPAYDPKDVPPYEPGEGYGENVIPFSGVAAPAKGKKGKKQMIAMLYRAVQIGDAIKERRARKAAAPDTVTQTFPVPQSIVADLGQRWFEDLASELGCQVDVTTETREDFGQEWQDVTLEGRDRVVEEAQLRMLTAMMPPPLSLTR